MPDIVIPSKDGASFNAYVSMPEKVPAPVILVIQEIFGVNKVMRDICDDLAAQGYIAVCPDLFWRIEPGIELTDQTEEEWARAFELFGLFDVEKGIDDLRAAEHAFRGHADSNGKIGCVGYCLGGKLAFLMACQSHIDVSVSYYGVGLDELTDQAGNIKNPVMLHIAEEDQFVSKDAQAQIKDALAGHDKITIHSYPGVNHAFARLGGDHYDEKAATLAHKRTNEFFRKYLAS